ncbi:ABC transporter permease [Streptomyces rochei]|uniref:ABC transporter permease n=1 Tax=Streptomyces rochei TaxID=1928 RepID=UPI0036FFAA96
MTATHLTDRLPFSPGITAATPVRVLQQISRDRGSTALLLGIPCMLMVLLKLMFHDSEETFERVGPQVFGIFPVIVMLGALLGLALGLLVSAFARNEFQAVQFLLAGVLPQFLVCGLFLPRDEMYGALAAVARAMPMTYAVQAAGEAATHSGVTALFVRDAVLILGCVVLVLVASAATLKRR